MDAWLQIVIVDTTAPEAAAQVYSVVAVVALGLFCANTLYVVAIVYAPISIKICGLGSVDTAAVDAEVILPYASTVMLAGEYVPALTAVVERSRVTVEVPVELMRPAVPLTVVTAPVVVTAIQAEPDQAYICEPVEFQYVAPVTRAPP